MCSFPSGETDIKPPLCRCGIASAAFEGHTAIASALLEAGAYIEASDNARSRPLLLAAPKGPVGLLRLLLLAEAEVDSARKDGRQAIHEAAVHGNLKGLQVWWGNSPTLLCIFCLKAGDEEEEDEEEDVEDEEEEEEEEEDEEEEEEGRGGEEEEKEQDEDADEDEGVGDDEEEDDDDEEENFLMDVSGGPACRSCLSLGRIRMQRTGAETLPSCLQCAEIAETMGTSWRCCWHQVQPLSGRTSKPGELPSTKPPSTAATTLCVSSWSRAPTLLVLGPPMAPRGASRPCTLPVRTATSSLPRCWLLWVPMPMPSQRTAAPRRSMSSAKDRGRWTWHLPSLHTCYSLPGPTGEVSLLSGQAHARRNSKKPW